MREFFKAKLLSLHIETGLQQYFKMSEMADFKEQFAALLDGLVLVCSWFPLIPDEDKKEIVSECMITDSEFIGFNKKIVWKWMNARNPRYFKELAHQDSKSEGEPASAEEVEKYLKEWREAISRIGNPQAISEGIKDKRIQQMKEQFGKIECKHTDLVDISETEKGCIDCGKIFPKP